jgi:hypothetical protein
VYQLSDGTTSKEYWVVPAAAQASLASVRAQLMPAAQAVQTVSKAYVDQAIQELTESQLPAAGGAGGSGNVNAGSTGQIAYYTGDGTAIAGTSTVPVTAGGTGASSASAALASLGAQPAMAGVTSDGANGLVVAGGVAAAGSFSGPGTGLTGTAAGLSIGGNAATATSATDATARATASAALPANGCTSSTGANITCAGTGSFGSVSAKSDAGRFNVMAYGATGNTRFFNDATIGAGSSTLSSASAAFTPADTGKIVTLYMGALYVTGGSYSSGIAATGSQFQTCTLTITGGGGSGATATVALTGSNAIAASAPLIITANGSGFTSAPTAATVSNGSATCSGTATIATNVIPAAVNATATYASATTVTLSKAATTAVLAGFASIGTDDSVAFTAAIAAASAAGGGTVAMPPGYYKLATGPLALATGVSFAGSGNAVTASGSSAPDTAYAPANGSWVDCAGNASCLTGLALRDVSLGDFGFYDWTGSAINIGGNNVDGVSFGVWKNLQFVGSSTINGSQEAIRLDNFQHLSMSGIWCYQVNTGLDLINQNNWYSGGNSDFGEIYVHTYAKSVANGNAAYPGVWDRTLAPSSGTAFPDLYLDFYGRTQVNSYLGDGTGMDFQVLGLSTAINQGERFADIDIEGSYFKGFDIGYANQVSVNINALYRASGNTCSQTSGSCDVYQESGANANSISAAQPITEYAYSSFAYGSGERYSIASGTNQSYGMLLDAANNVVTSRINGSAIISANGVSQAAYSVAGCASSYGVTTLNTSAAATTTAVNCLPANSIVDAVVYRVETTIAGITSFTVGDGSTAARFCSTQSGLTAGTTGTCLAQSGTAAQVQTSAGPVVITSNTTPTAGAIKLIVFYHSFAAPAF